jgi:Tol biopolymer transport system component
MKTKKIRWFILLISILMLSMLALAACGEITIGLITESPPQSAQQTTDSKQTPDLVATQTVAFTPEPTATEPADPFPALTFIGLDGNIWLREAASESLRQITTDAKKFNGESSFLEYSTPHLSSDGVWLAYSRELGIPAESGYAIERMNWMVNLETGEQRLIREGYLNGMAWKPGTRLLAFGVGLDMRYFETRGEPASEWATGILAIDADTGETTELVAPERGLALATPNWSGNGRFLAFAEVLAMEGSGYFAYYDFEVGEYVSWEEAIGRISWSPDGSSLTYSRQTYAASGEERIYVHNREGDEMPVGPDYEGPAYATHPVFSPRGDLIAYTAYSGGPESWTVTVSMLNVATGEVKELGGFENVWELGWSPDSSYILFSFGNWESRQIVAIHVETGEQVRLAEGSQLSLAGW